MYLDISERRRTYNTDDTLSARGSKQGQPGVLFIGPGACVEVLVRVGVRVGLQKLNLAVFEAFVDSYLKRNTSHMEQRI